jgi:hypothetical protein
MKTDIAFTVFVLSTLGVSSGNPKQRLAVAPAGHILIFMFEFEAKKGQQLLVKRLRACEITDAKNEMIDTDDARHELSFRRFGRLLKNMPPTKICSPI